MLRLENVSKYYHTQTSVALGLKDANLTFKKGEFVVITGESGSGKSTLLNVISGMIPYEEGEMYVEGKKTSAYDNEDWENYRREKIGFIYQDYNLIDSYTVLENVESVMLIKGQPDEGMRQRALEYIKQVGLEDRKNNRASQLSSGQKQRLSIARALAKDTDILVADEPTGNLDTENGQQVMQLLHELSAKKLVIVVTHNYEQAREFATRKIRLFDGEITEDIRVGKREKLQEEDDRTWESKSQNSRTRESENQNNETRHKEIHDKEPEQVNAAGKAHRKKQSGKNRYESLGLYKTAMRFLNMNKKAQPRRNLLIFVFLFCLSFSFYVFLGGFFSNMDGAMGKTYRDKVFANGDQTRLVVRKMDGSVMTEEDRQQLEEVKYVLQADLYDGISDLNYYCMENEDYRLEYHTKERVEELPDRVNVEFLDDSKYMKSATCISEEDLIEGRLPSNKNEIVISSKDKGKVGDTISVYMRNRNKWGDKQYVYEEMTIAGIVEGTGEKKQFYFYDDYCKTLCLSVLSRNVTLYNHVLFKGERGFAEEPQYEIIISDDMTQARIEEYLSEKGEVKVTEIVRLNPIFILNDEVPEDEVRVSGNFLDNAMLMEKTDHGSEIIWQCRVYFKTLIHYPVADSQGEERDVVLNYITDEDKLSNHGNIVYEIGKDLFEEIYGKDLESHQISVYIKDYAYTKTVLNKIHALGYEAISVYQVGAVAYDYDKVYEKLQSMCISLGAFVIIFFLGLFIIYAIMKLKKGDFLTLKSLGLQQKIIVRINRLDLYVTMLIAAILVIVLCAVLSGADVQFIGQLFKYYRWYHYMILVGFHVLFAGWVVRLFNRHLEKLM